MLLTIQFPFADVRKFLNDTGRLELPAWPLPTADCEFVQYFGGVRTRKLGGIEGWIGENEICEANNAIRFTSSISLLSSVHTKNILFRCVFRRLYFDGWAVGKFEIGISPKTVKGGLPISFDKAQVREIILNALKLKVRIHSDPTSYVETTLGSAGKHLAKLYSLATTNHKCKDNIQDWWISPGAPILLLQFNRGEEVSVPFWAKSVLLPNESRGGLFHCLVPFRGGNIRLWVLESREYRSFFTRMKHNLPPLRINRPLRARNSGVRGLFPPFLNNHARKRFNYNTARELRISLLRLHAEHESLRMVLRQILAKRLIIEARTMASDDLQRYFNNATARIGRIEINSAKHFDAEIIEMARTSEETINPGQRDTLLETLGNFDFRKNIFRKLDNYTNQWSQITLMEVHQMNAGDNYNVGQAGAVGPNAHAHDMVFNQTSTPIEGEIDIAKLVSELSVLRAKLKEEAVELEHDTAVGAVASAEIEAKKGNLQEALKVLTKAGSWAFDIATKIGVTVAAAAIKEAMGVR